MSCSDLLRRFHAPARLTNRDVTLVLALACSGLVIPYVRLNESDHPSADTTNFKSAAREFHKFLGTNFLDCGLVDRAQNSWLVRKHPVVNGRLDPGSIETEFKPVSDKKQTGTIIRIVRNSLAHGNIVTEGNPINKIFFFSRVKELLNKYNCVAVSPQDFKLFVEKWFEFLGSLHMPDKISENTDLFRDDQAA